jgi:putative tryptophan/tyrosine transport system substrate-binding protein
MTRHAMQRREFITLLGGVAAWPLAARAQQATPPPRIGWLSTGSPVSHRLSLAAFQDGLRARGYIEGGNVTIEYRWAEGNLDRLPELANQLVQQQVEIILAGARLVRRPPRTRRLSFRS